ncbi:MAG: hypothetical protein K8R59_08840 [Thermoanaerobaculales bacterium]|nr:hypothetical protein [Thermoanaerobaculales bacterium]
MGKVVPFRKMKKKSKKKRIQAPHGGSPGTRIVWQAALVRLPTWVQEEDDETPQRAWSAMALSLTRDLIAGPTAVRLDERSPSQVVDALRRLAETCGEWPDVVDLLIGLIPLPPEPPPYFKPGEITEAVAAAFEIRQMWTTSEGAMAWIEQRWNRYNRLWPPLPVYESLS